MKTFVIPSVLEGYNSTLISVTTEKINGLKIHHEGENYVIGNLALLEGKSPHKGINSPPADLDYKLLLKSGLLLASDYVGHNPVSITTGFPHATFNLNKEAATELISNTTTIQYDSMPFGGIGMTETSVNIEGISIIPELFGSMIAAREGEMNIRGSMFVVSIGYGTLEFGLFTENGFLQRTQNSGIGLRYAVDSAMKELSGSHYLSLRTEHQFDKALQNGHITTNRHRIDLTGLRKNVLKQYYKNVISPLIKNTWNDDDFNKANTMMLVGGGARYPELVDCFHNEFKGFMNIEIPDDPMTMASRGYCLHSARKSDSVTNGQGVAIQRKSIGLDIGNAHTCVSIIE